MNGWVRQGAAAVCVAVVLVGAVGATAAGGHAPEASRGNEPPLPDAGLDQEVPVNATVILDAGSSRDPDGDIESYAWRIETPGGNYTEPACADCVRTEFQVHETGTYNATVTVTDDDGATRSDTMRIRVHAVDGPTVQVAGPTRVVANDTREYTATIAAGNHEVVRADWYVDGELYARHSVEGESVTDAVTLRFLAPGRHAVTVEAYDAVGRTDTARLNVTVAAPADPPCSTAVWNATDGAWDTSSCGAGGDGVTTSDGVACSRYGGESGMNTGSAGDYYCHNDRLVADDTGGYYIHDADNDDEITWGGQTIELDRIDEVDGVTVNSAANQINFESEQAYEKATGFETLDPEDDVTPSSERDGESTIGIDSSGTDSSNDGDGGNNDGSNNTSSRKDGLPQNWKRRL